MKQDGPAMIEEAMRMYTFSNSPEMVAAAFLCLLPISRTKEGRK